MHLPWLVLAMVGTVTALAPASGRTAPARDSATIEVHDSSSRLWFQDASGGADDNSVTIMQGETVTFDYAEGNGSYPHNVRFNNADASECTPPLPEYPVGAPWSSTCRFDVPGVYDFFCTVHAQMTGSLVVEPDPNATPTPSPSPSPSASPSAPPSPPPAPSPSPSPSPSPTATAPPPGAAIVAHDNFFQDAAGDAGDHSVTVAPGQSVSFAYPSGKSSHNVDFGDIASPPTCQQTAGVAMFPAPPLPKYALPPGWAGECRFDVAGVYAFVCDAHKAEMSGTIVVAEPAGEEPTVVPTAEPTVSPSPSPSPRATVAATPAPTPLPFTRDATPAGKPVTWASLEPASGLTVARLTSGRLKLTARCASAGKGSLKLAVTRATARRLKLKSSTLVVARASCDGHGRFTVRVKPSRTVKRALSHWRGALKVKATLKLGPKSSRRTFVLGGRS
jgi:plastocyanin